MSLDDKYRKGDGEFYDFIRFCKEKIPQGSEVLLYVSWDIYKQHFPENSYLLYEYSLQKARYYLYPIRVHFFPLGTKGEAEPPLSEQQQQELLDKVSFVIDYYSDAVFKDFQPKYTFGQYQFIMQRERQ